MKDTYTGTNWRDFHQRYLQSFGWYDTPDGKKLVQIIRVNETQCQLHDIEGNLYKLSPVIPNTFEFIPASRGWYNTRTFGPVLFSRHPARQWSRGINAANTHVVASNLVPLAVDMRLMSDVIWDRHDYSEMRPLALSRQFMLHKNSVYLYNKKIGIHHSGVLKVEGFVVQELTDLVNRKNLPLKVNINGG